MLHTSRIVFPRSSSGGLIFSILNVKSHIYLHDTDRSSLPYPSDFQYLPRRSAISIRFIFPLLVNEGEWNIKKRNPQHHKFFLKLFIIVARSPRDSVEVKKNIQEKSVIWLGPRCFLNIHSSIMHVGLRGYGARCQLFQCDNHAMFWPSLHSKNSISS